MPTGCFDISSDDRLTYAELIKACATRHGLRRIWLPFPPIWPALVARIASWLTPLPLELTADLILGPPNSWTRSITPSGRWSRTHTAV